MVAVSFWKLMQYQLLDMLNVSSFELDLQKSDLNGLFAYQKKEGGRVERKRESH